MIKFRFVFVATEENLTPCLVLNKIDRLVVELNLDAVEAYDHLNRIIEQVNAVMSSFITADGDGNSEDESYFLPERGNVAFAR